MKRIVCLLMVFLLLLPCFSVYAQPAVKGEAYVVALADGQQIIFEKNADKKMSPSGLTKLFTALVAYDLNDINETVTVVDDIKSYTSSLEMTAHLVAGETISLYDLLGATVVGSANDAAYQTAIFCAGSVEAFVEKMNEKAAEMGLSNSHFVNPTGNYDENQYMSASDMLKVYRSIYKNENLKKLLTSQRWIIEPTNASNKRVFWTNNHLISTYYETKYLYRYASGGKISNSSEGGYSIAANASKGGMNIITIVFNSQLDAGVNYSLVDATKCFDYVFENYTPLTVVKEQQLVCELPVKSSSTDSHILVNTKAQLKGVIKANDNAASIEQKIDAPDYLSAPIVKGETVGNVEYFYDGNTVGVVELVADKDLGFSVIKYIINGIGWFFGHKVVKTILAVILILFIIFVLLFIYLVREAYKKRKKAEKRRKERVKKY